MVIDIKIPKTTSHYCPTCKKHTEQTVDRVKTSGRRKTSNLKAGSRYRLKKVNKGYGGSPYPLIQNGVKYGAKTSQKILLRYKCKDCGKKSQGSNPIRAKKFEIEAKE